MDVTERTNHKSQHTTNMIALSFHLRKKHISYGQVAEKAQKYSNSNSTGATEARIAVFEADAAAVAQVLEAAEAHAGELRQQAALQEGALDAASAELEAVRTALSVAEGELALLRAAQAQAEDAARDHAEAVAAWRREKVAMAGERDGFRSQVEALRDKLSGLSAELAMARQNADDTDVRGPLLASA